MLALDATRRVKVRIGPAEFEARYLTARARLAYGRLLAEAASAEDGEVELAKLGEALEMVIVEWSGVVVPDDGSEALRVPPGTPLPFGPTAVPELGWCLTTLELWELARGVQAQQVLQEVERKKSESPSR